MLFRSGRRIGEVVGEVVGEVGRQARLQRRDGLRLGVAGGVVADVGLLAGLLLPEGDDGLEGVVLGLGDALGPSDHEILGLGRNREAKGDDGGGENGTDGSHRLPPRTKFREGKPVTRS